MGAEMRGVFKQYWLDQIKVPALLNVNLKVAAARFTVLAGPSGSGKSTILHLLGGMDRPDSGDIVIAGQSIAALSDDELSDFRARHLGFVFQSFNLLPVLSALENVEYPLHLQGESAGRRKARALEMLAEVGLLKQAAHRPGQLSGGQRQRVAIARALVHKPALVLADEPTANLDSGTGASILALLRRLQGERGVAVVFSSHDPLVIAAADECYQVRDGRVRAQAEREALA